MAQDRWNEGRESFWTFYLRKNRNQRAPRPLLLRTLRRFPSGKGRVAIDLGCGGGNDSLALSKAGYFVHAVDGEPNALKALRSRLSPAARRRVRMLRRRFEQLGPRDLPEADLVNANYSLPFCRPAHFDRVWGIVTRAIAPGGVFTGNFLGVRDEWRRSGDMTFLTKRRLEAMFRGFDIISWKERFYLRRTVAGPTKRWHEFEIVAKKIDRCPGSRKPASPRRPVKARAGRPAIERD